MKITHPAVQYHFSDLVDGLMACVKEGTVNVSRKGDLALFNYSETCTFEHKWNEFSLISRGFILDMVQEKIIALTFPKFFNHSEKEGSKILRFDAPFDTFQKMDGSLGIVFWFNNSWHVATRGSFHSDQAKWAESWLHQNNSLMGKMDKNVTYLTEIIYPENRIVIKYDFEGLVLLGAYNRVTGAELDYNTELLPFCNSSGMRIAPNQSFHSFMEAQEFVKTLPSDQEGFVIRYCDTGDRLKLKGDAYCSLHKMISGLTPLGIWELLCQNYSVDDYKKAMPEEFHDEIDEIVGHFLSVQGTIMSNILMMAHSVAELSDRDLGIKIQQGDLKGVKYATMLFPYRKHGIDMLKKLILKELRPTGNKLEGYRPSSSLHRVQISD